MKSGTDSRRASLFLDFVLIFLLTAVLIWPLFKAKYLDKWASIESTFIADARFLKEHWPHPLWQPLWYGGTRFDYIYPPALRYGTAALAKFYPMAEARAYHLYTAFFYCVGIAGVYLLVRTVSGSRGMAWLAAGATAVISPSYLFLVAWRADSQPLFPLRLGVLVRYGEGPHITSLALLPIALAAAFHALREWRPRAMAAAAVCCALVVSNNFYGGTALAICFPLLVWSLWITRQDRRIWLRGVAIAALAYGLTAFWLAPSYLRVTTANLKMVSQPGNLWSVWVALAVSAVYLFLTTKWARGRRERFCIVFIGGVALFFSVNVLGNYFFGFRVAGEPLRLVPELDLALIMLIAEGLRRLWNRDSVRWRVTAVAIALISLTPALGYLRRPWLIMDVDTNYRDRVEFKLTEWMGTHLPGARALATGSVRFWYDAWRDLPQLGGGSEQGILNQLVSVAYQHAVSDAAAASSTHWLQCYGVDAILVHDKNSKEHYHDFAVPQKFAGILPVLFDDREGNVIYRVPRRFPDLARVVETARVRSLPALGPGWNEEAARACADALEMGPDSRAVATWEDVNVMRIGADVAAGQSLLVQVAYDPEWRAWSGGAALAIRKDALGQMLIETPPGRHDIRLRFDTPLENRVGQIASLFSALIVFALLVSGLRKVAIT